MATLHLNPNLRQLLEELSPADRFRLRAALAENADLLSSLPPELRPLVFRHFFAADLARCERVCRKWRELIVGCGVERHWIGWKAIVSPCLAASLRPDQWKIRAVNEYLTDRKWLTGSGVTYFPPSILQQSVVALNLVDLRDLHGPCDGFAIFAASSVDRLVQVQTFRLAERPEVAARRIGTSAYGINGATCLDVRAQATPWEAQRYPWIEHPVVGLVAVGLWNGRIAVGLLALAPNQGIELAELLHVAEPVLTSAVSRIHILENGKILVLDKTRHIALITFQLLEGDHGFRVRVVSVHHATVALTGANPTTLSRPPIPILWAICEKLDLCIVLCPNAQELAFFSLSTLERIFPERWERDPTHAGPTQLAINSEGSRLYVCSDRGLEYWDIKSDDAGGVSLVSPVTTAVVIPNPQTFRCLEDRLVWTSNDKIHAFNPSHASHSAEPPICFPFDLRNSEHVMDAIELRWENPGSEVFSPRSVIVVGSGDRRSRTSLRDAITVLEV